MTPDYVQPGLEQAWRALVSRQPKPDEEIAQKWAQDVRKLITDKDFSLQLYSQQFEEWPSRIYKASTLRKNPEIEAKHQARTFLIGAIADELGATLYEKKCAMLDGYKADRFRQIEIIDMFIEDDFPGLTDEEADMLLERYGYNS